MIIKHLFIGGGSFYGFAFFGLLKQAHHHNIFSMDNIKTIHGISVGSIIGTMISLKIDWDTLEQYLIESPWNKMFKFNMYSILHCIENRGIFSKKEFDKILKPLLLSKDLSCDITMREFYEYTNIEHCYFITKLNSKTHRIESIPVSYKTHPDWKLFDVVYMSSSLPILFQPSFFDGDIYLDGMLSIPENIVHTICNESSPAIHKDEIIIVSLAKHDNTVLKNDCSLFDYLIYIFVCMVVKDCNIHIQDTKYMYRIQKEPFHFDSLYVAFNNREERMRLIHLGINAFHEFHPEIPRHSEIADTHL